MNWQNITIIFIPTITIGILLYDVVAYLRGGVKSTISSVLIDRSKSYPIIPFLFGLLIGHLYA